jgi:hypothetical protein
MQRTLLAIRPVRLVRVAEGVVHAVGRRAVVDTRCIWPQLGSTAGFRTPRRQTPGTPRLNRSRYRRTGHCEAWCNQPQRANPYPVRVAAPGKRPAAGVGRATAAPTMAQPSCT